jgi:hypothetical protein
MNNIDNVKLPSNGLIDNVPSEVQVRGMKGREISTLYSSLNEAAIEDVIRNVTTPSLQPDILCDEDKKCILHKTRVLTFGNEIEQSLRCPFCGNIHTYIIDYDNFNFVLLDEDILSKTVVMSDGKVITKAIPTKASWDAIHRYKDKRNLPDTYAFLLLQAARIGTIDGKHIGMSDLIEYLENLPGNELVNLSKALDIKFGLDTTFKVECNSCHTDFTGGIGINADMFRKPNSAL